MKILTAYDTRDGVCLIIKENRIRKEKYIIYSDWYFYILLSDFDKSKEILEKYQKGGLIKKILPGKKYVRVMSRYDRYDEPSIDSLRYDLAQIKTEVFEFDLNKTKRYIIDTELQIEDDLNILYFDIETDDSHDGIEIGRDRIISFAACDNEKTYFKTGDEKSVLQSFVNLIKKYDLITGWNSEQFDLPYIQQRCAKHNIKYNWKSILHVDMYQRCFKIFGYEANIIGLKNFSLNEIAKAFLNETKTELSGIKIHKLEKENPELLKKYNIQDAVLLQKLDKKLSIIPLMIQECVWTGSFLNKFYIGELLDNYILREAKKAGMILQSRPSEEEHAINEEIDIVGGYVSEPQTGFYDNVHVCDFKSLYPSIIVGWNIGIDTLDNELSIKGEKAMIEFLNGRKIEVLTYIEWFDFLIKEKARLDPNNKYVQTANNAFFRKETRSFIGGLVQQLLDNRAEYKKKLKILQFDTPEYNNTYAAERVVKEMANSMFGITCDRRSRYFNKFVSEGITYTGQLLNKMSSHVAKSFGSTPIYGDTDSIFLTNAPDMIQHILDINVGLKDILDNTFGLFKNIVSLEFEKTFTKFILMKKKKYTGLLSMKDGKNIAKIFSRGTEDAKKTSIKLSKQTYLELVNIIFTNNSDQNVIEYIEKLRDHIYNDDIDLKDILLITRVSKPIASYKSLTLAGRLADRLIKEGKLLPIVESEKKVGTRLEYIVTKINDKNEGILLEEVNNNWNRDYYWEVQIFAPLKRVLDCTHPHIDWSKYDIQKIKKVRIKKNDTTKIDTIRRSR